MKEQHLLVDYENVQPSIEDLLKLAPRLTDVWLFHGPNQVKRAEQLKTVHERVTLVPHSGKGKNALDFHLSFYLGYVAARHPEANLLVVANDKGYDSMLGHAKLLGFTATRVGYKAKKASAAKKVAVPANKAVAARKGAAPAPKQAPVKKADAPDGAHSAAKKPPQKKAPVKKVAAKKVPAKKSVPVKPVASRQMPAKAASSPQEKALARAKASLAKMDKNRPTKLSKLLRHLKSIVGPDATAAEADALSRQLEAAKVIQVVGDLVLYP